MEAETMSNTEMGRGSSADEDAPDGGWGWIVCFAVGISQVRFNFLKFQQIWQTEV